MSKAQTIALDKITMDPANNTRVDLGELDGLVASMRAHGWLPERPAGVRITGRGHSIAYTLNSGFRRYAAAMVLVEAGEWPADTEVPAAMFRSDDEANLTVRNLLENLHRKGLTTAEFASGCQALKEQGLKVKEIAEQLGKNPNQVSRALKFARLAIKEVKEANRNGDINEGQARAIALLSEQAQRRIVREIEQGANPKEVVTSEAGPTIRCRNKKQAAELMVVHNFPKRSKDDKWVAGVVTGVAWMLGWDGDPEEDLPGALDYLKQHEMLSD